MKKGGNLHPVLVLPTRYKQYYGLEKINLPLAYAPVFIKGTRIGVSANEKGTFK